MVLGKEVTVILGTETQNAKALEIDDSCRLLVEFSDKTKKYICFHRIFRALLEPLVD